MLMSGLDQNITIPGITGATRVYRKNGKYYSSFGHNAGFFSTCTLLLHDTIKSVNFLKNTDISLDPTNSFNIYKNNQKSGNIFYEYFKHNNKTIKPPIDKNDKEFIDIALCPSKNLDFNKYNPFIEKYFTPSEQINNIIKTLEIKYNIDYKNTCCVFFRGLDKFIETDIPKYDIICKKVLDVTKNEENIRFLLQTDESEFFEYARKIFTNNIIFNDEIRHLKHSKSQVDYSCNKNENFKYSLNFLAIVIIMSRCKYVICNSSNVSLWISLFRGNVNNFHQYLKQIPSFRGMKNPYYDSSNKEVWY